MGNIKLKAQNILKLKQEEREFSLEKLLYDRQSLAKKEFRDKIQNDINEFEFNLLKSANNGEVLAIEILKLKDKNIVTQYLPIQSKIVTFLDETNFEFIADEIIVDKMLHKLYKFICDNGIYPIWRIGECPIDNSVTILYLEVNPLISFKERKEELQNEKNRDKKLKNSVALLYEKNIKEMKNREKRVRIIDFLITFFLILYLSVALLTILSIILDFFSVEQITDTFSIVAFGWPYFIFTEFGSLFFVSLSFGILFSFVVTYIVQSK